MEYLLSVYHNRPVDLTSFEAILLPTSSDEWINTILPLQKKALSLTEHKSNATVKEIFWEDGILACSSKCCAAGDWTHTQCTLQHQLCLPGGTQPSHSLLKLKMVHPKNENAVCPY